MLGKSSRSDVERRRHRERPRPLAARAVPDVPSRVGRAVPSAVLLEDQPANARCTSRAGGGRGGAQRTRPFRESRVEGRPDARPRTRIRRGYAPDGASSCRTSRSGRSSRRRARRWRRFHSAAAQAGVVASTGSEDAPPVWSDELVVSRFALEVATRPSTSVSDQSASGRGRVFVQRQSVRAT